MTLPSWRRRFRTRSELQQGPIQFFINNFLPEGVTFLGGLPGHGKSWVALSMAKALTTGQRFVGLFDVPEPQNVLYLAPESGEKSLRTRLELMDIPEDRFLCTTVNNGMMKLEDLDLMVAVEQLKPIVFLDTAIRFLHGAEENSSSETSASLANALFKLRVSGAKAIVGLHHSTKASATHEITLENALRGTGDIAAMCDAVYGVRSIDQEQLIVRIVPIKARDFELIKAFHLQGRPHISGTGDFAVLTAPPVVNKNQKLIEAIAKNPKSSYSQLAVETGVSKGHIAQIAARAGWQRNRSEWIYSNGCSGNVPASSRPKNASVPPPPPIRGGNGNREQPELIDWDEIEL